MRCRKIKLTQKYLDGELDQKKVKFIENHISTCSNCKKWIELTNKLNSLHKYLKEYKSPPFLTEKILANLPDKVPPRQFFPTYVWQLATAAVIILALFTWMIKSQKNITVRFELNFPLAESVSLVGDFNNWDVDALRLIKSNNKVGTWEAKLKLKPGRYQYMFVINGNIWIPDPNAKEFIDDGFGNKNSILDTTYIERSRV